jgi:phenylacetate-CoA ligase
VRKVLFRYVVSPFSAHVLRPGSTAARRRLEAFEWLDPEAVRQAQWSSLCSLLRHAAATVPYYRRTFAELGLGPDDFAAPGSPGEAPRPRLTPDDFARLPLLTKPTVRKEFPVGLVSERRGPTWLPWRRPKVFRTSGTTGIPLRFYRDPALRAHDHATRVWQYGWAGLQPGDQITYMRGTVYVSPWLYPFWSFFGGARHFPSHLYLDRDGEGIARVLDLWRPDGLIGHPPSLTLAAHALRAAGRSLRHPPKGIIVGGETVGRGDWRLMREAFGSPVHVHYGANKFGIHVAQSCPDRVARGEPPYENLHISALRFLVEIMDDDGRPVEPGREGRIVITDLGNRVMPFLRYDLGDRGTLAPEPCPCGRGLPLLGSLHGRTAETLVLPSGRRRNGALLSLAMDARADAIWEYQFRQTAIDHIEVAVVPAPGVTFGTAEQENLARGLRDLLGEPMEISFRLVDVIPRDPSGKRPLLKTLPGSERPGGRDE